MKTIETKVTIGEDHMVSIQLPQTIPTGDARIVVIVEERTDKMENATSSRSKWGKVGRKTQFDHFTPIKMKGNGLTASEMLVEGREQ